MSTSREFISDAEVTLKREEFFNRAREIYNVDTSSNSLFTPILTLLFEEKMDTLNELFSVKQNADINQSKDIYLDMEARKIGLKRHAARKALLTCKIIATGKGSISADTLFTTKGERQYRITEDITFNKDSDNTATLEALNEGAGYNLEVGTNLHTERYIQSLTHLSVTNTITRGEDREDDEHFRDRIFKAIKGFTLRDTKRYYESKLSSTEKIRETIVARVGANNTKFILRAVNESDSIDTLKEEVKKIIGGELETLTKIDYEKASAKTINISLKKNSTNINEADIKESLLQYFSRLKLGDTCNIYDMYKIVGDKINITEPTINQKADENQYFKANITFTS